MTPGTEDDRLIIRRRFRATREELFAEWTDPEGMSSWMCPGTIESAEVSMELRVGGSLLIRMHEAGKTYEHRGRFVVIEPPVKLAFTWIAPATDMQPTLVTIEFFRVSQTESELVLTHEKLMRTEVQDQYRNGWSHILERLAGRLERQL